MLNAVIERANNFIPVCLKNIDDELLYNYIDNFAIILNRYKDKLETQYELAQVDWNQLKEDCYSFEKLDLTPGNYPDLEPLDKRMLKFVDTITNCKYLVAHKFFGHVLK